MILGNYGYIRAAAAVPRVSVGDPAKNGEEISKMIIEASERYGVKVMVLPELSVTGYTCADLFNQKNLLTSAERALGEITRHTKDYDMLVAVGMPIEADNQLFNCAVVFHAGRILGVVPKTFLPNYNEFYEKRWFASSVTRISDTVRLLV